MNKSDWLSNLRMESAIKWTGPSKKIMDIFDHKKCQYYKYNLKGT